MIWLLIEEQLRFEANQQREKDIQDMIDENNKIMEDAEKERVDKFNADQEKIAQDRLDKEKEELQKRIENQKKAAQQAMDIFKQITDAYMMELDRRIEANREEISDSESNISRLQNLAAEGNVDAAEAIKSRAS